MRNSGETKQPAQRDLLCELTEKEKLERHKWILARLKDIEDVEEQKSEEVKMYNETLKKLRGEVKDFRHQIETGEKREVKCTLIWDWKKGEKRLIRLDTNVELYSEAIEENERQMAIGDLPDPPPAEEPEGETGEEEQA